MAIMIYKNHHENCVSSAWVKFSHGNMNDFAQNICPSQMHSRYDRSTVNFEHELHTHIKMTYGKFGLFASILLVTPASIQRVD